MPCRARFVCLRLATNAHCRALRLTLCEQVRSGEVRGDECVFFSQDVLEGQSVTMDYGTNYMLNKESQLLQFSQDHALRAVIASVLGHLDERVMLAVLRYYSS